MSRLLIENFSCFESAEFELAPLTVLIGPQGSGKSVTIKLNYFFQDIIHQQYSSAERGLDIEDFKRETARHFKTWFPSSAWGERRSNINFTLGPITVRVLRRTSKGGVVEDIAVTFSKYFTDQYRQLVEEFENERKAAEKRESPRYRLGPIAYIVRERWEKKLKSDVGSEFVTSQIFIPAGRASFTSIGRLLAVFEQGGSVDPATTAFAKLFANFRDLAPRRMNFRRPGEEREDYRARQKMISRLVGGELKFEDELEVVETKDGRKIPFTALSSGQQELLPICMLIDFMGDYRVDNDGGSEILYVEEPEAHLFPTAQSELMDFLVEFALKSNRYGNLVLTTHSPYILSKINTYLKAGSLGRNRRRSTQVAGVVPQSRWLSPGSIKAYAIREGTLVSLMNEDSLIDARYIDSVSEQVADTFDRLLDIEFPDAAR
jgi:predicted ATP-dependent endonuclease of OLD family